MHHICNIATYVIKQLLICSLFLRAEYCTMWIHSNVHIKYEIIKQCKGVAKQRKLHAIIISPN